MSMRTSIIYGYGFHTDCEEKKLIDFIKNHKEFFCKTEEEKDLYRKITTDFECDLENMLDGYKSDNGCSEGPGAVIENIMSRETGIRFLYAPANDECGTESAVLFTEGYPWQLNKIEKSLTAESLNKICEKYAEELGIIEEPDYLAQEYYG